MLALTVHAGGVTLAVHVAPRARRPLVGGLHGDALRIAVREPPADGRANAAVASALAEALGVPRAAVRLDPASRHRRKRVDVAGDGAALAERLRALAGAGRLG